MASVIEILEDLIRIDSINPFKIDKADEFDVKTWKLFGNETNISNYLEKKLKESKFKTYKQAVHSDKNNKVSYNILGEKGSGKKSILFYGHMDTVTEKPWNSKKEALTPTRRVMNVLGKKTEVIVGLGSNDMKAGVAVLANAFKDTNPKDYKIKVAFGVDEEFYSLGGNVLAKSGFMDDVVAIIVPEIGDGPGQSFGPHTITLGRLGRCEYIIDVPGTGGHGAQANNKKFVNAATETSKIALAISEASLKNNDFLKFCGVANEKINSKNTIYGSFFVSRIDAGDGSLSIPSRSRMIVDWTFTPKLSVQKNKKFLEKMIDKMYKKGELKKTYISGKFNKIKISTRLRPTPVSGAYFTKENNKFTIFVKSIVEKTIGFKNYNFGYSVADENVFSRVRPHIPILVIGPQGSNSHMSDEWVSIESVNNLFKLFKEIASQFKSYIK